MAKISPQVKEIIQIVIFVAVVGSLVYFLWIYPLNRTSEIAGRPEESTVVIDSLPPNDPTPFIEAGFIAPDTFRVDTDGLTSLAALILEPELDSGQQVRGTVILLHDEHFDRTSTIPLARKLNDLGLIVVSYDQRAAGLSSGKFHGEGQLEATDLIELISWLDLRTRIKEPLAIAGFGVGAEAALIAAAESDRIKSVISVRPYLTTDRMMNLQKAEHELLWLPFYKTIMFWWYKTSSGYAAPFREIDQIRAVKIPTTLFMPASDIGIDEVRRLVELSGEKIITVLPCPENEAELETSIVDQLTPKILSEDAKGQ